MTVKGSGRSGEVGPGGDMPGFDMAITVLMVVAVIGAVQQWDLWPEGLDGAAGTIVPAGVVVVLAAWRTVARVLSRWWRGSARRQASAAKVGTSERRRREGDAAIAGDGDDDALGTNAALLAAHLPDPTMFPPSAANDDEERPSAM